MTRMIKQLQNCTEVLYFYLQHRLSVNLLRDYMDYVRREKNESKSPYLPMQYTRTSVMYDT